MIEQLQHGIRGAEKGDSEDLAWLRSRSRSHIHAFEVICDVLDLSADFIRAGLEEHRNGGRALGNGRLPRLPPRLRMAAA